MISDYSPFHFLWYIGWDGGVTIRYSETFTNYERLDSKNGMAYFPETHTDGVVIIMNEKQLQQWKDYQAGIGPVIEEMSDAELDAWLQERENIIFEQKALHQRGYQLKKDREYKRGPRLPEPNKNNGTINPNPLARIQKEREKKAKTGKEKIAEGLALLGIDMSDGDVGKELTQFQLGKLGKRVENDLAAKDASEKAKPITVTGMDCAYSPTGQHNDTVGNGVCNWCGEKFKQVG